MRSFDKRIIVSFGTMIFLLVIGAAVHFSHYSQAQKEHRERAASYEVVPSERYSTCAERGDDFARLLCLVEQATAEQEQERARANLHAQQDMAMWAAALLWASVVGIAVSLTGILVIYATLHETRQMTVATREIGEAQTRAYILIRKSGTIRVSIQGGMMDIHIKLPFENAGATPAFDPTVKFRLFFFVPGPRVFRGVEPVLEEIFDGIAPMAPNGGEYILDRRLISPQSNIEHGILQTARHRNLSRTTTYIHVELYISGKDYAGRSLPDYKVFVDTNTPFDKGVEGNTTLSFDYPGLITDAAAGYGPPQDVWVVPTREDFNKK